MNSHKAKSHDGKGHAREYRNVMVFLALSDSFDMSLYLGNTDNQSTGPATQDRNTPLQAKAE